MKNIKFETVDEAFAYLRPQDIREGIAKILAEEGFHISDGVDSCAGHDREAQELGLGSIMDFLRSKGLVKVIEGELPKKIAGESNPHYCAGWYDAQQDMLEAGYRLTKEIE